jgi:glycogen debranching enzyme
LTEPSEEKNSGYAFHQMREGCYSRVWSTASALQIVEVMLSHHRPQGLLEAC